MSEELEAAKEAAKAVQEVAKTGRAAIEPVTDLARWFGRMLGTIPEDVVGLAGGDYLRELRIRNMNRIRQKTDEKLRERGIEQSQTINSKVAIPAIEAASAEDDETLQERWARLFANAMDPDSDIQMRRIYVETLSEFEAIDTLTFEAANDILRDQNALLEPEDVAQILKVRDTQVMLSIDHLESLGCFKVFDEHSRSFDVTALGKELWLACRDSDGD